ncbi:hypothetical protein Tco_0872956 [Tanacetum coccineum]
MVVPRGTAAPVLLKWFVSRDVPTGAPSSNGTIIPIPIPSFPLLVYLHSRKFIRSTDGAKSGVLVRTSRPILLPNIIGRSSSETRARKASSAKRERARRRKGQRLQPNRDEQGRNDKMRCPGHPHLERRVEVFGPVALPVPPSSGGACVGGAPEEIRLEALTLPTSRQLMVVGHDYYKKAPMKMNISHGRVHKTLPRNNLEETPFSLTYGSEDIIPTVECIVAKDGRGRTKEVTKRKESKEVASIEKAYYQNELRRYHSKRNSPSNYKVGDFVLLLQNNTKKTAGMAGSSYDKRSP